MNSAVTYKPSADEVKRLREATAAGMIECRNTLVECSGDFEAAKTKLIEAGQSKLAKKADRAANEGLVGSYIHAGGKIGVLVEVNSETDFVARNEKFGELVRDIAMHVAAMSPQYLDRASVPEETLAAAKEDLKKSLPEGKKPEILEKILEGKLEKWFEEHVLLEQPFVKDDSMTVQELIGSVAGILGENIKVRRFAKFALGEV